MLIRDAVCADITRGAAIFCEIMHCCGASYDKRNRDCQAEADCLEKRMYSVFGWEILRSGDIE